LAARDWRKGGGGIVSYQESQTIRFQKTKAQKLEDKKFAIFALARENRHCLDSERVLNKITELLDLATADIAKLADELANENEKLRKKLDNSKRELKKVKESVQWNC
jgi:hypothetical protein